MRRRLLATAIGLVLLSLLLFAVPLGLTITRTQEQRALEAVEQQVVQLGALLDERVRSLAGAGLLLSLASDGTNARYVLYDPSGTPLAAAGPSSNGEPEPLSRSILEELGQGPVRVHRDGRLSVVAVTSAGPLQASVPDTAVVGATRRTWLVITGVGLVVLVAAGAVANVLGRRLAEPLEDLAESARRMAGGDFTTRAPRSGVEEADAVAAALDHTSDRLGSTLERSYSLAADASHQLRSPLTALQLEIEALEASGAEPDQVAALRRQADRLEATVDEFLTLATPERASDEVDVAAEVSERAEAWRSVGRRHGRDVVVDTSPVPAVPVRSQALGQALQVLLDNALEHGTGTVRVTVDTSAPGEVGAASRGVCVSVVDDGPREPSLWPPDGTGRGLKLARSLVESEGGRLSLERRGTGTRAAILLPVAESVAPADRDTAGEQERDELNGSERSDGDRDEYAW